jgi:ParB-like chromosome segregation protein Spo0J
LDSGPYECDFDKLVADIKANGLRQHIVRYQGKILDGNNRYRACALAGIEPTFADFTGIDADAQRYVISANIHRRHLSPTERAAIVAELMKLNPTKSNRQLGEEAKLDHKTVGKVRTELEATGEIPQLAETTGADGKKRKTKTGNAKGGKGKGKQSTTKETVKIEYKKAVDHKTALNAYSVLEEHLLDALRDIEEFSSFGHAEEYADRTKGKIEETIDKLRPQEETEEEAQVAA